MVDNIFYNNLTKPTPNINSDVMENVKIINDNVESIKNKIVTKIDDFSSIESILKSKISEQVKLLNKVYFKPKIQQIKKTYESQKNKIKKLLKTSFKDVSYNECLQKIPKLFSEMWNKFKKSILFVGKKIKSILTNSLNILSKISSFFVNITKTGISIINKLLFGIPGKIWGIVKDIFKYTYKAVSWVVNIGVKALEYIWAGVSTIFKFGYEVALSIGKFIYKGTKAFFSWWFKLVWNTIMTPGLMWFINIPLLIIISTIAFSALGLVVTTSFGVISTALEKTYNLISTVGGWIWDGIVGMFTWLQKNYENSWIKKEIIDPALGFLNKNVLQPVLLVYNKIIEWAEPVINWTKSTYYSIKRKLVSVINDLKEFWKRNAGETFFEKIVNLILGIKYPEDIPVIGGRKIIPEFIRNSILSRFGFVMTLNESEMSTSKMLLGQIKVSEINILTNSIENQYSIIRTKFPKISEEEILNKLKSDYLPQLSKDIAQNLKSDDIQKAVSIGIKNAQNALETKTGFIDDRLISEQMTGLLKLYQLRKIMISGDLDAMNEQVREEFTNSIINVSQTTLPQINASRRINEEQFKKRKEIVSVLDTISDMKNKFDVSGVVLKLDQIQKLNNNASILKSIGLTMYNILESVHLSKTLDPKLQNFENGRGGITEMRAHELQTIVPTQTINANGNILLPDKKDLSKTIPLNTQGIVYLKNKLKDIDSSKYYKKEEEKTSESNITIIENTGIYTESYELYTLNHLSKGILRS